MDTFEDFSELMTVVLTAALLVLNCCEPVATCQEDTVLLTEDPGSYAVQIINLSEENARFRVILNNQKFFETTDDVIQQIRLMSDEYDGEPLVRKVWRFVRDNRYHGYPLARPQSWYHHPAVFFNSAGVGWCGEAAAMNYHIWKQLGYKTRIWDLAGHVVSEVYNNNRWELYDSDEEVYYLNGDFEIAGVAELANNPQLITDPINPVLDLDAAAYWSYYADCYGSKEDNSIVDWEPEQQKRYDAVFMLPPEAVLEFPGVFARPLESCLVYGSYYEIDYYANLKLTIPGGWSGFIELPLFFHEINGKGTVVFDGEGYRIGSPDVSDLLSALKERDTYPYRIQLQTDTEVELVYLINPHLFKLDYENVITLQGDCRTSILDELDVSLSYLPDENRVEFH